MRELKNTYQLWHAIVFVSTLLTLVASYFLIHFTWEFGTDWGSFEAHVQMMLLIIREIFNFKLNSFYEYKEYLTDNGYVLQWLLHILIPFFTSLLVSLLVTFKWLWIKGGIDKAIHTSGSRLFKNKFANKHAKKALKKELKNNAGKGLNLHPHIRISEIQEAGNILVTGAQGSGKSTVLKPILKQLLKEGNKAVIYDAKREYTETFLLKPNYLFNPTDNRSLCWDIMCDVQTPEQARQIATSLISEDTKEPIWSNGAREILTGCFIVLLNGDGFWSWSELKILLDLPLEELKKKLTWFHPKAANLIEEDSKTTQSFLSIIATETHWIDYVSTVWTTDSNNKFSIRRWVNGAYDIKGIIIANDPRYSAISKPLCNVVLNILTDELLSFADNEESRFWLVLDELADLPKTKSIEKWLALGRSKGARTLAGTQNISQIQSIYGDKNTETITSLFSNIVTLKIGSSLSTAKKIADNLGKRLVKRATINFDKEGNKSTSYQQSEEYIVRPEELMQLPSPNKKGVTGYLSVSGWNAVYELVWPYPELESIAAAHVPVELHDHSLETLARGSRGRKRKC